MGEWVGGAFRFDLTCECAFILDKAERTRLSVVLLGALVFVALSVSLVKVDRQAL